ncbi:MAG: endonuclease [Flavobacteriales bacterium]|nr:endonuclease [Flavobacteriales bacterium]
MRKLYMMVAACLFLCSSLFAQTTLVPGDIAIIGFNTDDADVVKFVALTDIATGTQIKFTDNGWNGTALATSEGTATWTAASAVAKGTVVTIGMGTMALSTSGDQVFAYQGTATAPAFIYGLSSNPWVTGSISSTSSRKPAALTTGTTAIAFTPERDNGKYNITAITGDKATLLASIGNTANWVRTDTRITTFPSWAFNMNTGTPEPVAQPTSLVFSNVKSYRFDIGFTAASPAPDGYIVLRAQGGLPNTAPVDGVTYTLGQTIGNATVISNGTATSSLQESVRAGITYGVSVFSYLGTGANINYRQASPLSGTVISNAHEIGTYYDAIDPNAATFIDDLQNRIRSPYTKVTYDNYDETMMTHFAFTDAPGGQRTATCVYSGQNYNYTPPFTWYTSTPFSREHTWCVSWTPSNATSGTNEYCDQHHLFPTYQNEANAVRSNHPLGVVTTLISSFVDGKYGYDANGQLVYEPRNAQKGDAARALLYMSLRYNGINGYDWTFDYLNNVTLPAMGESAQDLATLIAWHNQDAPDSYEIARNDYIQSIQQNRNPFIDHPEWVANIQFNNLTPVAPAMAQQEEEWLDFTKGEIAQPVMIGSWPNPAQDQVMISVESDRETIGQIMITDMMGRAVLSQNLVVQTGYNPLLLDLNGLSNGTYLIVYHDGVNTVHNTLIKE